MIRESIAERIIIYIKETMPLLYDNNKIDLSMNLIDDLGFESISLIMLITEIENGFNIVFDYDLELEKIVLVSDLIDYVCKKIDGEVANV